MASMQAPRTPVARASPASPLSPTMSLPSPLVQVPAVTQASLRKDLTDAKAKLAKATNQKEVAFFQALVGELQGQVTDAQSPGTRLKDAERRLEDAKASFNRKLKALTLLQDETKKCVEVIDACTKQVEDIQRELAPLPAPADDQGLHDAMRSFAAHVLSQVSPSSSSLQPVAFSPEHLVYLQQWAVSLAPSEAPPQQQAAPQQGEADFIMSEGEEDAVAPAALASEYELQTSQAQPSTTQPGAAPQAQDDGATAYAKQLEAAMAAQEAIEKAAQTLTSQPEEAAPAGRASPYGEEEVRGQDDVDEEGFQPVRTKKTKQGLAPRTLNPFRAAGQGKDQD